MFRFARVAAPAFIAVAALGVVLPAHSVPGNAVVINEVETRGLAGGNDEFIELHNNTPQNLPIGGWSLRRCNGADTNITSQISLTDAAGTQIGDGRFPDGTMIPANGFLVIGHTSYTGAKDFNYFFGVSDQTGVQLAAPPVKDADGNDVFPIVDRVGFSGTVTTNACVSGVAVQNTGSNDAYTVARTNAQGAACHALGHWTLATTATPGQCNGLQASGASAFVKLSEVDTSGLGAGTGSGNDEFIELRNNSAEAIDLSGWSLFRCNSADTDLISQIVLSGSLGTIPAFGTIYVNHTLWTAPLGAPASVATYSIGVSDGTGVQLRDAELDLVDSVGFSGDVTNNKCVETAPAAAPVPNGATSVARTVVGGVAVDTNVNAADFSEGARTPGA